jgi:transcriptional regulator with XRE-family HTH domain
MRTTLLRQISERRKSLDVRTSDMPTLAGINRQQYEKIEKGGNPSLATLDRIAEGLDAELLLVPKEHINQVRNLLATLKPSLTWKPIQRLEPQMVLEELK